MYGMLFECGDVCFCWLRLKIDVARSVSGNVLEPDFHFQIKTIRQKKTKQDQLKRKWSFANYQKSFRVWFSLHINKPYLANGQPFKLLGITYLIGKIKFKLFFQGPLAK